MVDKGTCSYEGCVDPGDSRGWCPKHYGRWYHHGDPSIVLTNSGMTVDQRFCLKVDRRGDDECWPYTGSVEKNGYGKFSVSNTPKVRMYAHRYAYAAAYGPIPVGADIDHDHNRDAICPGGWICMHRRCCNPKHLKVATRSQNLANARTRNGQIEQLRCPWGHRRVEGASKCRVCNRLRQRWTRTPHGLTLAEYLILYWDE